MVQVTTMTMVPVVLLFVLLGTASFIDAKSISVENGQADPKILLFLSGSRLWRADIDVSTENSPKLIVDNPLVDYDLDATQKKLFWLDRAGQIFAQRIDGKSSDKFAFQYQATSSEARIAYDFITNKFYAIDGESQEVDVIDVRGKNRTILFPRSPVREEHVIREKPKKVVLDPEAGLMFILTDFNGLKNIYQCSMDGFWKQLLVPNAGGDEFTVDPDNKRIYWTNLNLNVIESADYNGEKRVFVVKIKQPVALAVYNNQLFWSTDESGATFKNGIKTCKLIEDECEESTIRQIQLTNLKQRPHSIKVIRPTDAQRKFTNPCQPDNGGCQHFCLLTSTLGQTSCKCNSGWEESMDNPKTCQLISKHLTSGKVTDRSKRQGTWDMYSQQPTLRPDPQLPQQPSHIPIYIFYPGK